MYPPLPDDDCLLPQAAFEDNSATWLFDKSVAFQGRVDLQVARQVLDSVLPVRVITWSNQLFILNIGGSWNRIKDDDLRQVISDMDATKTLSLPFISRVVGAIKVLTRSRVAPGGWLVARQGDPLPRDLMFFANGYVNVSDKSFHEYDGRLFAVDTPIFDYDPNAKCPTWNRFLSTALLWEDADTLQAFMGLCMVDDISRQVLLVLVGDTARGKSTTIVVIEGLVGARNIQPRTLKHFSTDSGLDGTQSARVIVVPETPDEIAMQRFAIPLSSLHSLLDSSGSGRSGAGRRNGTTTSRLRSAPLATNEGCLLQTRIIRAFRSVFLGS